MPHSNRDSTERIIKEQWKYISKEEVIPMGRRGSTYRARLEVLVNTCMQISIEKGKIHPSELVQRLELSERMIRDYINDLLALDIIRYQGDNQYAFNNDLIQIQDTSFELEPFQKSLLTRALEKKIPDKWSPPSEIQKKVEIIFNKIQHVFVYPEELRTKVAKLSLTDLSLPELQRIGIKRLEGEKFIEQPSFEPIFLHNFAILGSTAQQRLRTYRMGNFSIMTFSFLAASAVAQRYVGDHLDRKNSEIITRPRLESFSDNQPFSPMDPFYEMLTDFPELLMASRSIATRYLTEILHIQTLLEILRSDWFEKWHDSLKIPIIFKRGALIPHGFHVQGKALSDLKKHTHKLFYELISESKKQEILIAGISTAPRDDIFFRLSSNLISEDLGKMNDLNFFQQIMNNNDVTCLVERKNEKGKPELAGMFDFYNKQQDTIIKGEFYSLSNPVEERNDIVRLLTTTFSPAPKVSLVAGPSVLSQAEIETQQWLEYMMHQILTAINLGFNEMIKRTDHQFNEEMKKRYLNEG